MKTLNNKIRLASGISAISIAAALSFATPAGAQTAESTLRGTAPAGTKVVATEVDTGAVRTATANSDGTYVITGLQPGNYHVTAGAKAADVVVPVASVQVQNFPTTTTAEAGAIVVTGTRPTAEVHTSQVNQFVTLHDISVLPQVTRNFLEFADTVPGMQFEVNGQSHNTSLRGGAQLASSVNVYIDGQSQKDQVAGGSGITGSSGPQANGDPGNPFPQLAIAEYKVVTSNYSAEYGDAASSIIIAQTKSGTNQFHGEAFGTFDNQSMRARYPDEAPGTPKGKESNKEYGFAFSGPIAKDVAHFFFTWEHKSLDDASSVYPQSLSIAQAQALLPADVGSQFGPVTNPFNENLFFGKIDVEPTINDRIELTGKLRYEHSVVGGGGQAALSTEAPFVNDDKRVDLRWQHSGSNWVNEVLFGYQNTNSSTTTTTASPQNQYIFFPNPLNNAGSSALIQVGGPGSGVGTINAQKGYTLKDDFTLSNLQLAGDHTLRVGFGYANLTLTTADASANLANATYYYAVLPTGTQPTPYEIQFPLLLPGISSTSVSTKEQQYSAYVQDDWNVNRHLVFNLGLRWDHEVVPSYLHYRTPADVVAALNGPFPGTNESYASVLAKGFGPIPGYNINDYISTGNNRKAPDNFSPRLGFSYDLYGDNRHVIFGGYGRAYDRNLFHTLSLETLKIALNNNPQVYFPSPQTTDSFGAGCLTPAQISPDNHCYAWDPSYLTPAGLETLAATIGPNSHEVDLLNNNLKTPYSDQFSLGMRNKIGDWNTQATISYIKSYDSIIGRLGNRYASGAYFQNGSQWGAQGVPGFGALILWDNGGNDRNFQIGLAAQKPYTPQSGWSATISYTFSAAKQNNIAGGSNPYSINNNQYLFDLPYPNEYPYLLATAVPRHRLVATYSRDLFWGLTMAGKLEVSTPPAAATIFGCPNNEQVCNQYGGNTVFYSVRPHKLIGYKDIDLQVTKNFSVLHKISAYARIDVLNVFNWHNYDPGAIYYPTYEVPKAIYRVGGPIIGTPFKVKLSAGFRF